MRWRSGTEDPGRGCTIWKGKRSENFMWPAGSVQLSSIQSLSKGGTWCFRQGDVGRSLRNRDISAETVMAVTQHDGESRGALNDLVDLKSPTQHIRSWPTKSLKLVRCGVVCTVAAILRPVSPRCRTITRIKELGVSTCKMLTRVSGAIATNI